MDATLAQQKIKAALKQILKRQNYTYADLAKVWDCSVPTVKRQLGPEELPVSRLLMALEWLNLSLTELQKISESDQLSAPKYTAKQNEFLAKNPQEFSFLMKLHDDLTVDQIVKKYKLTPEILQKILIQLEKYDLIRVGAGGRVKPYYPTVPRVDGSLARAHMSRIIERTAQFHKLRITEVLNLKSLGAHVPKGGLSWNTYKISEKTSEEYLAKFHQLMSELVAISKIEEKTLKKSELKVAATNFAHFLCEPDDRDLPLIMDMMDEGLRTSTGFMPPSLPPKRS